MLQPTCHIVQPKNQRKQPVGQISKKAEWAIQNTKRILLANTNKVWALCVSNARCKCHSTSPVGCESFFPACYPPALKFIRIHFESETETETETEIEQILSPNQNLKYATWAMEMVMETKVPSGGIEA